MIRFYQYANMIHDLIESNQLFVDLWSIVRKELHPVHTFSCFIIIHYQITLYFLFNCYLIRIIHSMNVKNIDHKKIIM